MNRSKESRLAEAASSYLRSARYQPVNWHSWGEDAFAKAQREDKPVLLDIGAVWCHWCHVMDSESYEDARIAALINELFVPIKVDRDERPDVDARYQAAVAAISGQSGWPLTAFLTPEGEPYFGGTYFAAEERYGRPSFERVLRSMAEAYRTRRAEVNETAGSVLVAIEENETFADHNGTLDAALLHTMLEAMLGQFDPRNGGFGSQPKFPHAAALDLLLDTSARPGPLAERAREVVRVTLAKMAAGGIHDQLAGGFHRYSVDERWVVPHFEKMAYDNSELLRVYAHAATSFADPEPARVASGIVRWMDACLSDRERGGFYAAQVANATPADDGDFFTWTRGEAEAVLLPEEFEVTAAFYGLRAVGDMQGNPAKNVLRVAGMVASIAASLGLEEALARALLTSAQAKLQAARMSRPAPFVDKTVYAGWNGLCISAYLAAGRALARPDVTAFALKSLDRVLADAWRPATGLLRVVAYGEAQGSAPALSAVLDDYVHLGIAALDGWEASGELRYFTAAEEIAVALLSRFYDARGGGFFDMPQSDEPRVGALRAQRKPVQDAPTPAGNPVAASLLLRLSSYNGKALLRERAQATLATFAGVAPHLGLYGASFGQALRRLLSTPVQICVIGADATAEELAARASARFQINESVLRLRVDQLEGLPAALASTLEHISGLGEASVAVVCTGSSCLPPARSVDELDQLLAGL